MTKPKEYLCNKDGRFSLQNQHCKAQNSCGECHCKLFAKLVFFQKKEQDDGW